MVVWVLPVLPVDFISVVAVQELEHLMVVFVIHLPDMAAVVVEMIPVEDRVVLVTPEVVVVLE